MNINTTLKIKGFNIQKLTQIVENLKKEGDENNLKTKIIHLKKRTKKITVLKGPHVHKKARDQFELSVHTKVLSLFGQTQNLKDFLKTASIKNNEDLTYHIQFKKQYNK